MSNLDFIADWDVEAFKADCIAHRLLADAWPVTDTRMVQNRDYHWKVGRWRLTFMQDAWPEVVSKWKSGVWHGSASVYDEVGHRTLIEVKKQRIEAPYDKWLSTDEWEPHHFDEARFLLATMFGPIIRPKDNSQRAVETRAFKALHWQVPVDGGQLWTEKKYLN